MKKILVLLLVMACIVAFAQKAYVPKDSHYPAKYVLKSAPNDTVRTHIQNIGAFKVSEYYPATWIKRLTFFTAEGKRQAIKENDLRYVQFVDNRQVVHTLVDSETVLGKNLGLVEELYRGPKIGWYSDAYYVNIYGNIGMTEYVMENGKETLDNGMFSNFKKKMKDRFSAYPDLLEMLDKASSKQDYVTLFKAYEAK